MRRAALLVAAALALAAPPVASAGRFAYVATNVDNTLIPIDTSTNAIGPPISAAGAAPWALAITPDGTSAYVVNNASDSVVPINLATNTPGTPILVGGHPDAIAITPDGTKAYVVNGDDGDVSVIDIATNSLIGLPIPIGVLPFGIAITPDGTKAYVTDSILGQVTPIDLATNTPGLPITVGDGPAGLAITPDGQKAYVANNFSNDVTPIDVATDTPGTSIPADDAPIAVGITPDGTRAYVPNCCSADVTVIDTATNAPDPTPIPVGANPQAIAITPDGTKAYVANSGDDTVTPIDTSTNMPGTAIPVGAGSTPFAVAITPDQPPVAAFTSTPAPAGSPTGFNGSGSSDPDGTVAEYSWDFGDGGSATTNVPTVNHTYAHVGNYAATLTVTDNEGCSTALIFTGQTALCNGSLVAQIQHQVNVLAASPTLTTMASPGIVLGGQVHDTATIAGGAAPGGSITFRLYDASCSGTPVFTSSPVAVSGNGSYDSPSFTPTAAGTYGWTASYSGDADNNPASSACDLDDEQVVVSKVSPTLTTTASASVTLGGQVHDTATLAGGSTPSGQITFRLFGASDASCSGAPVFTSVVSVSGNGGYDSASFSPAAPGTYRWTASYAGDANNNVASSTCNAAGESVTVSKISPTLTTTASANVAVGGQVHDTAAIAGGSAPSGQGTFTLYGPNDAGCSGTPVFTSSVSVSGNGSYDSADFSPSAAGTYRWTASYSGDANNNAAAAGCNAPGEQVTVNATVPGPPTGVSAVAGNAQAKVFFSPPASDGGAPIISYTVTASPGGAHASGPGSPITVTGLMNGTTYTFTVTATNSAGTGPPSAASNAVIPQPPEAPTISSFTPSSGTPKTVVTITGTHFIGTTKVLFNGKLAVFKLLPGGTQLIAIVPFGATSGPITVVNGVGFAISSSTFTVLSPAINSLEPDARAAAEAPAIELEHPTASGHGVGLVPQR